MAQVKFWRGVVANYNATTHKDGIYFATDTQEIYLDGKAYGGAAADATALQKAIVKAEYTAATASAAGTVTLTAKDNTTSTITLPSVAAGNGVDVTCGDNGAYTVAVKLDASKNKLATLGADGLAVTAKLNWDSVNKKMQLLDGSDVVVSEFDGSAFVKDGFLNSVAIKDKKLVFTWNTDAADTVTEIALTDIFNPYTIGNGLTHDTESNTLSVKVKEGDKYIAVGADGVSSTALVATMDASIQANETAIAALNGSDSTAGSVAKAVKDAKEALVGADTDADTANTIFGAKAFAQKLVNEYDNSVTTAASGDEKLITVSDAGSGVDHAYTITAQTANVTATLTRDADTNALTAGASSNTDSALADAKNVSETIASVATATATSVNAINSHLTTTDASISALQTALEWNEVTAAGA